MVSRFLAFIVATITLQCALALSPMSLLGTNKAKPMQVGFSSEHVTDKPGACDSRRMFLSAAATQICLLGASSSASAADSATIYKSGKAPIVPGQKPKDKGDVKGTRKDPDFLRSVADCKNQCQSTNGPDGLARSKEDCLSECQDICCTTYEQVSCFNYSVDSRYSSHSQTLCSFFAVYFFYCSSHVDDRFTAFLT